MCKSYQFYDVLVKVYSIENFFKVLILFQSFDLWLVNLIIIHVDNLQQHKRDCIFYFLLMASICKPKCHWTSMIIIFAVNFVLKFTSTDSEIFIRYIPFVNVFWFNYCTLFFFLGGGGYKWLQFAFFRKYSRAKKLATGI